MSEHPSRFMLERHCVGDLSPAEREKTLFHLESCATCQVKVGAMKEQSEHELERYPADEFVANLSVRMGQEVRKVSQIRRWAVVSAFTAMAAAAAFALIPRPQATIALRGSGLQVHRNRDGMAKLMETNDRIRAGDALRVVVTLPHAEAVDAWFVDATGRVDRLLATSGALSLGVGEQTLPGSAVVDAPCADMWLVVGVGKGATQAAESTLKGLGPGLRSGEDWVPKGCLARRLRCE